MSAPAVHKPAAGGALFWGEHDVIDPDDPDMAALLALHEELTAEERAEAFKERGNEALKRGQAVNLRHAVAFYTQGIECDCDSNSMNSILYANRAQANLLLSNWGRALSDGRRALALDPRNLKACFRAAKAAATLGRHAEAAELCAEGLKVDAAHAELLRLQTSSATAAAAAAERSARASAAARAAAAEVERTASALESRGLVFGPARFGGEEHKPRLDREDGRLRLRLVLLYPQSGQTDLVEEICEDDSLTEHLDGMFGPDAPPLPWDEAGEYTRERLEVYWQRELVPPFTPPQMRGWLAAGTPASSVLAPPPAEMVSEAAAAEAARRAKEGAEAGWVQLGRFRESEPLGKALAEAAREGHVLPGGTVVLFVCASGSEHRADFLRTGLK